MSAYKNFRVAVYTRAFETTQMGDLSWLTPRWERIAGAVNVDKVYLETHRDLVIVDDETLNRAKAFFAERGIETAGGITLTISEPNNFQTFDYANPEDRAKVQEIVEHTARHFDELILDDFFFTSSKSLFAIEAKGDRSWTEFRLALMTEAATSLVIGPAKAVNPNCKVVIKYPNWYEHFQGLGFNLADQPAMFDGLYTGTETRDSSSAQHLQPYHGYSIMRYFENLKPGGNDGGWVDIYGCPHVDRYAEQLWITLLAKAREITLFNFVGILDPIPDLANSPWRAEPNTTVEHDALEGDAENPTIFVQAAGQALARVDQFLGELGNPIGVQSYRPAHSLGEDALHSFLGMIGIPMEIVPDFPTDVPISLVTEHAAADPDIVAKIKQQLVDGKDVMITSGFLRAKQDEVADIVELRYTDQKALVNRFKIGWFTDVAIDDAILIPQIKYLTNDSWELVSGLEGNNGWPLLHMADYANGTLYVFTIPENMEKLYKLPVEATSRIKHFLTQGMDVMLDGPGKTSLYLYDNNTLVVESFHDEPVEITLRTVKTITHVEAIGSGETFTFTELPVREGGWFAPPTIYHAFQLKIAPHSLRALRLCWGNAER